MRDSSSRRYAYKSINIMQWGLTVLLPVMGWLIKLEKPEKEKLPGFLADSADWTDKNAWWLLIVIPIAGVILQKMNRNLGSPRLWDHTKALLDEVQKDFFSAYSGDNEHHHRVTLFKRVNFHWRICKYPWHRRLVPVVRSGHFSMRSSTSFKIPDDADKAEGVAGMIWARSSGVVDEIFDLPDLSNSPSERDFEVYAGRTHMPIDWVRKKKPKDRSYAGIRVEKKDAYYWGIIVLSSRNPARIELAPKMKELQTTCKFLSKLLERA